MKTKTINRLTGALLAMFIIILFALNACSSDDPAPVPDPDPVITSWVLPAGDFPSVAISKEGNEPVIGDPIKTITKIHVGDFSPKVNAYKGMGWHGIVKYDLPSFLGVCGEETEEWSIDEGDLLWSNNLPEQTVKIVFPTSLCADQTITLKADQLGWTKTEANAQRWRIMEDGTWYKDYFNHDDGDGVVDFSWKTIISGKEWVRTSFKQLTHPDLYITMERDYEIFPGNDEIFQGGRSYEVKTTNALGVVETQINTMGASLSVDVSAGYGPVSGSINATVYAESSNELAINKFESKETTVNWTVPEGEKWRNLRLTKVERYYFSDSEGKRWDSENLDFEELGELKNYIGTNYYEIHYKDNNVIYWAFGDVKTGIEDLKN